MRFVKQYLSSISGVEIYPLVSLLVFVIFFVLLLLYVNSLRKRVDYVHELENIPLQDGSVAQHSVQSQNPTT